MTEQRPELAAPPPGLGAFFGDRGPLVERYAELLATAGVERGLIGPREVPRLWDRHILNCAVVAELIPPDVTVYDVGSGAGLPGLVLAMARPDLDITLLEPLLRRTRFLEEAIDLLGLENATVTRARAEEWAGKADADVVTARAVAPLDRLARWCLPLLRPGGEMLALKGSTAGEELVESARALESLGAEEYEIVEAGQTVVETPTTVVRVRLGRRPAATGKTGSKRTRKSRSRST